MAPVETIMLHSSGYIGVDYDDYFNDMEKSREMFFVEEKNIELNNLKHRLFPRLKHKLDESSIESYHAICHRFGPPNIGLDTINLIAEETLRYLKRCEDDDSCSFWNISFQSAEEEFVHGAILLCLVE